MSHATVFRRLTDMELRLGVALFERARTGYSPTLAGEDLADVACRVESDVLGAERRIAGQGLRLSGTIRVTTTDTLYAGLLAPLFTTFRENYPQIELEVVISNQLYSLSKREADIAIRPTRNPPETLVGRRVGTITQAVYGQKEQWQQSQLPVLPDSLSEQDWIGPDTHMGDTALEAWMKTGARNEQCHYRMDTMLGMQIAVGLGSGIAVLPCYLGDADERLVPLTSAIAELATPLWLLTHPDLRRVARIRVFLDDISVGIRATGRY